MIPYLWIEQASERILPYIKRTPLTFDPVLNIYLKWENHQVTGSFKPRGALNKVLSLQDWELEKGLVAASAGNHGQGVALAGKIKHTPVIIFASEHASPGKIDAMRQLGAVIHLIPGGYGEAEQAGISYAKATGAAWVSPYNDGLVIAGQATICLEVIPELPQSESVSWVVPVGGGGLISGIGSALYGMNLPSRLIAVQSGASPFMHAIYTSGTQDDVVELASLADGLAGPVEPGSITIPIVKSYVTDFVLVTEQEIRKAIKYAWVSYHERIEGSSAAPLAAVLSGQITSKPAIMLITGGNIDQELHEQILNDITL